MQKAREKRWGEGGWVWVAAGTAGASPASLNQASFLFVFRGY